MERNFRETSSVRRLACGLAAILVVTALLATGSQGTAAAASSRYLDPIFSAVRVQDLTYGRVEHPDGTVEKLKLDLYKPIGDRRDKRPVLIFIHGGDSSIDKGFLRNRQVPRGFARRGFLAASINYREGTNGATPQAAHDTRAAVRWFKANAEKYRVNPAKIIVMGSSAGSMNALHVAFDPDDAGDSGNPGYSSKVAAAIAISAGSIEPQDIGPDEVPIAMVHAVDDMSVPIVQAYATCNQTRTLENVCDFFQYAEGGHPPEFLDEHRREITEQTSHFICRSVLRRAAACQDAVAPPPPPPGA